MSGSGRGHQVAEDTPNADDEAWHAEFVRRAAEEAFEQRRVTFRAERRLKSRYANALLAGMFGQILVADAVFVLYASSRHVRWSLSAPVVDVWVAAAVVQVVGIVEVVARHLFPRRDTAEA